MAKYNSALGPVKMRLTPEQEAEIQSFRLRYVKAALSPKRANRAKLHAAIADIYAESGKPAPKLIVLPSPAKAKEAMKSVHSGPSLWQHMFHNIQGSLWRAIDGELARHIRQHTMPVETAVYAVLHPIYDQLHEQSILPMPILFGSSGLCWMVWAKYAEHIGVRYTKDQSRRLAILERISFECEFWWPSDGVCLVSERPVEITFNRRGQLHSDDGPAVEYDDGYCLYAHDGERLKGMGWVIDRRMV
jgi:hypothetical protein